METGSTENVFIFVHTEAAKDTDIRCGHDGGQSTTGSRGHHVPSKFWVGNTNDFPNAGEW